MGSFGGSSPKVKESETDKELARIREEERADYLRRFAPHEEQMIAETQAFDTEGHRRSQRDLPGSTVVQRLTGPGVARAGADLASGLRAGPQWGRGGAKPVAGRDTALGRRAGSCLACTVPSSSMRQARTSWSVRNELTKAPRERCAGPPGSETPGTHSTEQRHDVMRG